MNRTISDIEALIADLLQTVDNLKATLPNLDPSQLAEAYEAVSDAEDRIDDFVFSVEDA